MVSAPQSKRSSSNMDSKDAILLNRQENDQIFRLLGERCQSLATGVIQLFLTSPPDHSTWIQSETGVLCFVKDNIRRSYFFRLYCPLRKCKIWEQQLYNNIDYKTPRPYLHTFEAEDGIAAFNFANENEATNCRNAVLEKLAVRRKKKARNSNPTARVDVTSNNYMQSRSHSNLGPSSATWNNSNSLSNGSLVGSRTNLSNGNLSVPQHQRSNSGGVLMKTPDKLAVSKKRRRNLTTRDISAPDVESFQHVSHVGFDADKGFDGFGTSINEIQELFDLAGVSERQLHDTDTRNFIYDFLRQNGVDVQNYNSTLNTNDLPRTSSEPPPVPVRSHQQQVRTAPPPPPARNRPTPVNLANNNQTMSSIQSKSSSSISSVQSPPSVPPPPPPPVPSTTINAAPIPPPPPPPPMNLTSNNDFSMVKENKTSSSVAPPPQPTDARSALLESIRNGKKLRHVEVERKPSPTGMNSRSDLLSEIRQGVDLKPLPTNAIKSNKKVDTSLAGALARALIERSRAIHSDSDTSDTTSDEDEEWED